MSSTVSDEEFRADAVAWLEAHAPAMRKRLDAASNATEHFEAGRSWQRELFDGNWAGITYPREYGGRGGTPAQAATFAREQARFSVSAGFIASTVGMVGPVLLRFGDDEQRARYLRPLLRADETWCQLFSEPAAGSDLANLATRAMREGDEFVVNGQKVWTSNAHLCDYAILLARTNVDVPKHRGITFFVLDLHSPGIEVRPLRQITGAAHFNEVFLTDVRVPAANIVGELDHGWAVARTVLSHEASVIGGGNAAARGYAQLAALAREVARQDDPMVRQALARAYTGEAVLRYLRLRLEARVAIDPSVLKVLWAEARRDRAAAGVAILGAAGALDGPWPYDLLEHYSGTIGGGTSEIHRTMIGERALGLPPEPRVDRDVSYRALVAQRG
jgi:acyl-CoA dehydrogenase